MKRNVEKKQKRSVNFSIALVISVGIVGIWVYWETSNELFINMASLFLIPLIFGIIDMEQVHSNKKRIGIASFLILLLTISHSITSIPNMMQISPKGTLFNKILFYAGVFALSVSFLVLTFTVWFSSNKEGVKFQRTQKLLKRIREKKKTIKKEYREIEAENDDIKNENQTLHHEKEELEGRLDEELNKKYIPIIKVGKLEIAIKKMER